MDISLMYYWCCTDNIHCHVNLRSICKCSHIDPQMIPEKYLETALKPTEITRKQAQKNLQKISLHKQNQKNPSVNPENQSQNLLSQPNSINHKNRCKIVKSIWLPEYRKENHLLAYISLVNYCMFFLSLLKTEPCSNNFQMCVLIIARP